MSKSFENENTALFLLFFASEIGMHGQTIF